MPSTSAMHWRHLSAGVTAPRTSSTLPRVVCSSSWCPRGRPPKAPWNAPSSSTLHLPALSIPIGFNTSKPRELVTPVSLTSPHFRPYTPQSVPSLLSLASSRIGNRHQPMPTQRIATTFSSTNRPRTHLYWRLPTRKFGAHFSAGSPITARNGSFGPA